MFPIYQFFGAKDIRASAERYNIIASHDSKNTYRALPRYYGCFRIRSLFSSRDISPDIPFLTLDATAVFLSNIDLSIRGKTYSPSFSLLLSVYFLSGNISKSRLVERNEISPWIGAHVECKK